MESSADSLRKLQISLKEHYKLPNSLHMQAGQKQEEEDELIVNKKCFTQAI